MSSGFTFNRQQRFGVLGLLLILSGLIGGGYYLGQQPKKTLKTEQEKREERLVQGYIDSLKKQKTKPKGYKIYPFNPNFITDYKGYRLGMSPEEIDRLHRFRQEDKWVNSKMDFKRVTQVSDSLLNAISPYFKFPDWVVNRAKSRKKTKNKPLKDLPFTEKEDINSVSAERLQEIKGIGPVLSKRIVRYRAQIGGFKDDLQLKDIYGLRYETRKRLLRGFTVKSKNQLQKLDLNVITTAELIEIPYFNYELARKIINFRATHEGVSSFEELAQIEGFPFDKMDRIKLYLKLK